VSRIAIVSQFYAPEPCAAANRIGAMARAFAEAGHEVRVYTALPSFPEGVVAPAYRGKGHLVEADGPVPGEPERRWVSLYGADNRVDHCFLAGKANAGATVAHIGSASAIARAIRFIEARPCRGDEFSAACYPCTPRI